VQVQVLRPDLVLVDWGPMTLTISAWAGGQARPVAAAQTARQALRLLAVLADFQNYLKRPISELPPDRPAPSVVKRARDAAQAVGRGLTPLAAVAGAVADELSEVALELGADKVIVNNGGDIALRLTPGQTAQMGLRAFPAKDHATEQGPEAPLLGRLNISDGDGIGGVATSGWGGRSFSLGLADAVSVWAASAALADAAATALGNAVTAEIDGVTRQPASEIDPASDLGDVLVTTEVPELSPEERAAALAAGREEALRLRQEGNLIGCLIALQGDYALLDNSKLLDGGRVPSLTKG
jgi:ApbE superfamily uncharacterized protein (UPF0280 family)